MWQDESPSGEEFLRRFARDGVIIIPKKLYRGGAFKGFFAAMDSEQVAQVRATFGWSD